MRDDIIKAVTGEFTRDDFVMVITKSIILFFLLFTPFALYKGYSSGETMYVYAALSWYIGSIHTASIIKIRILSFFLLVSTLNTLDSFFYKMQYERFIFSMWEFGEMNDTNMLWFNYFLIYFFSIISRSITTYFR